MNDRSHAVVGIVDLPVQASWSPDAWVRIWMTTQLSGQGEGLAGARSVHSPEPQQQIRADLVQIRHDLDELFDAFLDARSTQVS